MTARPIHEDDLQALVDDRLDPARRPEVEAYLAGNPDARARVERLRRLGGDLRAAFAPVAVEPVPARLNLAHIAAARRSPRGPTKWVPARWVPAQYAAAASVLLALGGLGGWALHGALAPSPAGIEALAQEASASFAVYAPDRIRPVELAGADRDEIARWFSARLARRVGVPDLSAAGYRLMGGRLVATAQGPAGLLMYDDSRGTRLVMLIRPMAEPGDAPMREHTTGSAAGYAWAKDGLGYSLVGPADLAGLHPLANEIRRTTATNT
ncbi:Transmembrane transcriptional regulator (anti-sigma factor RsiW) [Methylobacterium sp. 174MFSha1.1]|uniref:anti-sigma factor family protein n=1 Tax=Methylobacterium sp. 174MFSha1.1 TaxID=1502749 RepID=UPI0008DF4861|nr:anti-sigma factor [Methylobacterium sp. 174MFSha1.1]SFU45925.1 Transmembrane transcriptional regulator (anti-sigma factor RsiW) [Methylobacterium sp. 174MFSha1.1]